MRGYAGQLKQRGGLELADARTPPAWRLETVARILIGPSADVALSTASVAFLLPARHTGVVTADQMEMISTGPGVCTARP